MKKEIINDEIFIKYLYIQIGNIGKETTTAVSINKKGEVTLYFVDKRNSLIPLVVYDPLLDYNSLIKVKDPIKILSAICDILQTTPVIYTIIYSPHSLARKIIEYEKSIKNRSIKNILKRKLYKIKARNS